MGPFLWPFRKLRGLIKGMNGLAPSRRGAEEGPVFPGATAPLGENRLVPPPHADPAPRGGAGPARWGSWMGSA